MAKDNRIIRRGVRIDNVVYTGDQQDEVAAKLSKADIQRLCDNGTLEGDWGQKASPEGEAEVTGEEEAEKPARGRK